MEIAQDLTTIDIKFQGAPDEDWYVTTFKARALEDLLGYLGAARTGLKPPVSPEWALGQNVKCFRNPVWSFELEPLAGDLVLHLRDERFGWLHYVIDKDECGKFAGIFAAVACAAPPKMQGTG